MKYFLSEACALKWLEVPSVYHIKKDDLYELNEQSFLFLRRCYSDEGCSSNDHDFVTYCLGEGILSKDNPGRKRPPVIKAPEPSLRYLELQITDRCNLRCKHCFIGDSASADLPTGHIHGVLREFEVMQGLRVLISGGEPLMHRDFSAINEILPDFFVRKVLFTNGLLLSRKKLKGLQVDEIQISIDGLQEAHDSLRGKGTHRAAMEAVQCALDEGFEVSISTMVHPGNLHDFGAMDRQFKAMGIRDWTVDIPCVTGRLKEHDAFSISPEAGGKYLRYGFGEGLHVGASGFGCGLHLMAVMADGVVAKCTFFSGRPVGRIEDGLGECWKRIKPVRLDELQCNCHYIESCRGGCRYRAMLLGNLCGKDLYRCSSYGIMK